MGKEKYIRDIEKLFEKSPVISSKTIERIIRDKNENTQYQKQLIRNMILSGKIKRLSKGFYTIHDEPSLAVFCFKPAYLGLQDALSFHNLWEQETIPVIITASTARPGIRKVLDANVMVRKIEKKYLFGFDYHKQGEQYLPYSDREKTFIDMIYFKEKLGREAITNIKKRIDRKKVSSYLRYYPRTIQKKVMKCLSQIKNK